LQSGREGAAARAAPVGTILRQCRRVLVFAFFLTLLANILALVPVVYMLNLYDRILPSRSIPTLISLVVVMIGLYIFWSALEWVRSRLLVRLSLRIDWDLALDVFDGAFRRHVQRRNVNVHQVLNNLLTLRQFMTGAPLLAIMDAPFAIVFIVIGGVFHPYLAAFALVASIVMLIATFSTQKVTTPLLRAANDASVEASRLAAFNMRNAETAYALGMQDAIRRRWYAKHRDFLEMQVNASEETGILGGAAGFLMRALPSLQLSFAAWLAIEGLISHGMVIAASVLISRAISPINRLLGSWKEIVSGRQAYEQLEQLLVEDVPSGKQMKLPAPQGRLVVTDAYAVPPGASKAVVGGVNFAIEPGQTLAVVGPSASGKTCLTKLLTGVWKPGRGSVRLDGVEVSDWNHEELGPQIGYVPQEIDFFEGTIAENIARLGPVDPDKVVEAAQLVGTHEMILAFPKGYDTMLGENGLALSAGQRQRIAMARALYGIPRYIVMDEPNSNLDEPGEQALAKAISELKQRGCTIVLTTHRPRLINVVDHLLVLSAGTQLRFGPAKVMLEAVRKLQPAAVERAKLEVSGDVSHEG
jgi:PrtD family type I secretion system ABC transporter